MAAVSVLLAIRMTYYIGGDDARRNESQKFPATGRAAGAVDDGSALDDTRRPRLRPDRWRRPARAPQPRRSRPPSSMTTSICCKGAGGNMALQTGAEGNMLIDASFAPAVPRILEAIAAVSKDAPDRADQHPLARRPHRRQRGHARGRLHDLRPPEYPRAALHAADHEDVSHHHARRSGRRAADDHLRGCSHAWRNGDSLDLVHFAPAHTDTDIYIHFHKANVLHVGDIWFNGMYPFIDEGTGGSIGGMISRRRKSLAVAGSDTKIIPGHGPLGTKAELQVSRHAVGDARQGGRTQGSRRQRAGGHRQKAHSGVRRRSGPRAL